MLPFPLGFDVLRMKELRFVAPGSSSCLAIFGFVRLEGRVLLRADGENPRTVDWAQLLLLIRESDAPRHSSKL